MQTDEGVEDASQMEWLALRGGKGARPGDSRADALCDRSVQPDDPRWDAPKSYPCDDKKDFAMRYTANDIFYAVLYLAADLPQWC